MNTANLRTNLTRSDDSTVAFTYDQIGQLTIADSSVAAEDRGYAYDKAWNLSYRTNSGALSSFTVDVKNQLVTAAGANCSYDANGNLVQVIAGTSLTAYSYDDENQLVMITNGPANAPPPQMTIMSPQPNGGWKAEFTYDGQGRLRVRRDYYANSTGYSLTNTTRYIYDGRRVIQERDGSNVPVVSYTRGTDLSGSLEGAGGIGGLLARSQGATHASYFADGNGNITALSSGNLNVLAAYRYDPYGNLVSKSGTLADANLYRFSSKEFHVNSGLYYYLYRFYHPNFQRWINRDPIGERGGLNLYGFVGNNPLSFWDVLGLYVNIVYDVAKETLTATDVDTGKSVTLKKVYSGNGASCCKKEDQWKKNEGPIPTGKYLVGLGYDSGHGGDDWWYKLYGDNGKGGYSYDDIPVNGPDGTVYHRGGFNLHTGRASDGCVTVWSDVSAGETGYPKSDDYNKLKELLDKTKPLEYKGSKYSGWLEVKSLPLPIAKMKTLIIVTCCFLCSMTLHAQNKKAGVDSAMELLGRWRTTDITALEQEISHMTNVDTLRIVAFASRSASFPGKAEDVGVDDKLSRIFWAAVRALCKIQTDDAVAARRIILDSGLVQGGDRILFKTFEERERGGKFTHGDDRKADGGRIQSPADKAQDKP